MNNNGIYLRVKHGNSQVPQHLNIVLQFTNVEKSSLYSRNISVYNTGRNTGYSYSGHLLCESFGEVKHYTFLLTGAGCLNSAMNINVSLKAKNF